MFQILDSVRYMIVIPIDSEEVATLLENHAMDWGAVLNFLDSIARKQNLVFNKREVAEIMRKKYE